MRFCAKKVEENFGKCQLKGFYVLINVADFCAILGTFQGILTFFLRWSKTNLVAFEVVVFTVFVFHDSLFRFLKHFQKLYCIAVPETDLCVVLS